MQTYRVFQKRHPDSLEVGHGQQALFLLADLLLNRRIAREGLVCDSITQPLTSSHLIVLQRTNTNKLNAHLADATQASCNSQKPTKPWPAVSYGYPDEQNSGLGDEQE